VKGGKKDLRPGAVAQRKNRLWKVVALPDREKSKVADCVSQGNHRPSHIGVSSKWLAGAGGKGSRVPFFKNRGSEE